MAIHVEINVYDGYWFFWFFICEWFAIANWFDSCPLQKCLFSFYCFWSNCTHYLHLIAHTALCLLFTCRYLYMVNFIERWSWERPSWYFEPVKVHKHSRSCVDFPNPEGRDVFFAMFFNCSECCVLKGGMGCGGGGGVNSQALVLKEENGQ